MAKRKNIEELVAEQAEVIETVEETVETVEEQPTTHTVTYGETWVSISELYRGDRSNHEYAKELINKNKGVHLTKNAIIVL